MTLDKNIKSCPERIEYVENLLKDNDYTPRELELMGTYLLETEKSDLILTNNRMQTIKKRETSLEQIQKDYVQSNEMKYNETKSKPLTHKTVLTEKDFENEYIRQLEEIIQFWKNRIKDKDYPYPEDIPKIKSMIINLKKDQYALKMSQSILFTKIVFPQRNYINYYQQTGYYQDDEYHFVNDSTIYYHKSAHLAAILQYYYKLKDITDVKSTIYWILIDFENLVEEIKDYKKYYDIVQWKMKGHINQEIIDMLINKYGESYSLMYLSTLINKTIPTLLAKQYIKKTTDWVYTYKLRGKWKKCSKCGQIKLAHRLNFSLNKRGKYGFHSICKSCRKGGQ